VILEKKQLVLKSPYPLGEAIRDALYDRTVPDAEVQSAKAVIIVALSLVTPSDQSISESAELFVSEARYKATSVESFKAAVADKLRQIYEIKAQCVEMENAILAQNVANMNNLLAMSVPQSDPFAYPIKSNDGGMPWTQVNYRWSLEHPGGHMPRLFQLITPAHVMNRAITAKGTETFSVQDAEDVALKYIEGLENVSGGLDKDAVSAFDYISAFLRRHVGLDMSFEDRIYRRGEITWRGMAERLCASIVLRPTWSYYLNLYQKLHPTAKRLPVKISKKIDHEMAALRANLERTWLLEVACCLEGFPTELLRCLLDASRIVDQFEQTPLNDFTNTPPQTHTDKGTRPEVIRIDSADVNLYCLSSKKMVQVPTELKETKRFLPGQYIYVEVMQPDALVKITSRQPGFLPSSVEQISNVRIDLLSGPRSRVLRAFLSFACEEGTSVFRINASEYPRGTYYFNTYVKGQEVVQPFSIGKPRRKKTYLTDYYGIEIVLPEQVSEVQTMED
jgi:hypothetical protein